MEQYIRFFQSALGKKVSPYPYQIALATAPWPGLLNVQTGLGKTASLVISHLFKLKTQSNDTPRRLVYCLPTRVLVEQIAHDVKKWISNLQTTGHLETSPDVYVLKGGDIENEWDSAPEGHSIIIGTQDQLISRAINRGYSMSRFRWPVHFGLLNNDAYWVFDEIQLMSTGLSTTTQLQAFRKSLGTVLPTKSIWVSATAHPEWLATVDFKKQLSKPQCMKLSKADLENKEAARRLHASKTISKAPTTTSTPQGIATFIREQHRPGTRTLVILNTVKRSQEVFRALKKKKPKANIVLIHSRFRPAERAYALESLLAPPPTDGTICIATQAIEAGIDVSATVLITDLAPWASLVQRFGRCNRDGRSDDAQIFWLPADLKKTSATAPYIEVDLQRASSILKNLGDASPTNLSQEIDLPEPGLVIRQKDIIELADTTPDLAGDDIDISRFIRETDDNDISVFWRDLPPATSYAQGPAPSREELCSAPIGDIKKWLKDKDAWLWDHLSKTWQWVINIVPGMTIMLNATDGGYSENEGWTGDTEDKPSVLPSELDTTPEANNEDRYLTQSKVSLTKHTDNVVSELEQLLDTLALWDETWVADILRAARWHDLGKSHEVFQTALPEEQKDGFTIWAKPAGPMAPYFRKGFRHELASALAMLEMGHSDLAAYLVAAHHGKVRFSIRSLPHEFRPQQNIRFARGICEGDRLPSVDLGGGVQSPTTTLSLEYMEIGYGPKGESWLTRMLALRDAPEIGPFRLAFMEALLRVADWRASKKESINA